MAVDLKRVGLDHGKMDNSELVPEIITVLLEDTESTKKSLDDVLGVLVVKNKLGEVMQKLERDPLRELALFIKDGRYENSFGKACQGLAAERQEDVADVLSGKISKEEIAQNTAARAKDRKDTQDRVQEAAGLSKEGSSRY